MKKNPHSHKTSCRSGVRRDSGFVFIDKRIAAYAAPTGLVLLCLVVFAWSVQRASAAWHFSEAQKAQDNELAAGHIAQALERFPGNPDYLDFSGRLLVEKTAQNGVLGNKREQFLETAAGHFRQALAARPLWPYSWVNLLSVKDKQGGVDAGFNTALEQSVATGPWEPRVQMGVLNAGLRNWDELGGAGKELLNETLGRAVRVQPRQVFELVRFYARPELVCGRDTAYRQIENWCGAL